MKLIVISDPEKTENEAAIMNSLFENGLQYFHLRKPGMDEAGLLMLLKQIRKEYYDRIVLHSHFSLVEKSGLRGYHFNRDSFHKMNDPALLKDKQISVSCHSFSEIENYSFPLRRGGYAFLSPVFNSISKINYKSSFDLEKLKEFLQKKRNIIALGGVDENNIVKICELGFDGFAMLGAIWEFYKKEKKISSVIQKFNRIKDQCLSHVPAY